MSASLCAGAHCDPKMPVGNVRSIDNQFSLLIKTAVTFSHCHYRLIINTGFALVLVILNLLLFNSVLSLFP